MLITGFQAFHVAVGVLPGIPHLAAAHASRCEAAAGVAEAARASTANKGREWGEKM